MRTVLLLAALLSVPAVARSEDSPASADLTSIGLEGLMQLDVTSVSRHEEPLFRAASAITVLTAEDIERSGATNIPDLLRTVPGMNVAQINANTWAVSARGFNGQYANKMLVLVDGRAVYNSVFASVYWDVLDLLIEDVDRIEVIRGPGATAWGANAVNGVINIITRRAGDAPGMVAIAGGGSNPNGFGGLRYAGPAGPTADFRVFGKAPNVGRQAALDRQAGYDGSRLAHVGGRLDWRPSPKDRAKVQGDYYDGTVEQRTPTVSMDPPYASIVDFNSHVRGGNLMGSWQHTSSATSDFEVRAYFDRSLRPGALISENLRTYDVDFQHRFAIGSRHDFMWGGGYRIADLAVDGSSTIWFTPTRRSTGLANVTLQDAIVVVPRRLTVTLGSKFEHNEFSGFEAQPSARFLWSASPTQTMWGAVSRAVRTPGRADVDVNYNLAAFPLGGGAVGVLRIVGADMHSEAMTSMELGYRAKVTPQLSLDLTGFDSRYVGLRSIDPGAPFPEGPSHIVFPFYVGNGFHTRTRGLEGTLHWQPTVPFGVTVSHSVFRMRLEPNEGTTGLSDIAEGDVPTYQLAVQPHLKIGRHLAVDAAWYHVDDLPAQGVPAYDRLDARVGWTPIRGLEFAFGVQNLFHDRQLEFTNASGTTTPTTVRTGAYGKVTWKR